VTLRVGLGVFRMRTAHSMSVVGGFSSGTIGSSILGPATGKGLSMRVFEAFGAGGGSANSTR